MANLVKYGSYEPETAAAEQESMASGAEYFKVKVGKSVVRFLPPPLGKKSPFRVVWQHFLNLPGIPNPVTFACPQREASKACPVCARAETFKKSGNDADYKKALDLFPKRRIYSNIIDRENPEKGVQVFAFGKMIHEALVKIRQDENAGGDFCNPENGFDVVIEREGTGKNDTNYTVMAARKSSPLGDMNWIEQQHSLEQFAKVPTEEEIRAKVNPQAPGATARGLAAPAAPAQHEREVNPAPPRSSGRTAMADATQKTGEAEDADVPF